MLLSPTARAPRPTPSHTNSPLKNRTGLSRKPSGKPYLILNFLISCLSSQLPMAKELISPFSIYPPNPDHHPFSCGLIKGLYLYYTTFFFVLPIHPSSQRVHIVPTPHKLTFPVPTSSRPSPYCLGHASHIRFYWGHSLPSPQTPRLKTIDINY